MRHKHVSPRGSLSSLRTKTLLGLAAVVVAFGIASSSASALDDRSDPGTSDQSAWSAGEPRWCYWTPWTTGRGWRHDPRAHFSAAWPCDPWVSPGPTEPTPEPTDPTPTPDPTTPTPDPTPDPTDPTPTDPTPTTPTPTPSPSPTGGPVEDGTCAADPSSCGYPDASNTGVAGDTVLRTIPGDVSEGPGWRANGTSVTIDGDGAVLEDVIVPGSINVTGDDVTIRNVRVGAEGDTWGIGLQHAANTTITQVEILSEGARLEVGIKDVYGDATGTEITKSDIARTATGIQTAQGLIQDNYIHDLEFRGDDHVNGTTSNGNDTPLTIRHNTVFNPLTQTDAVSLFQDFGVEANRTIDDNLLAGGGYTIYGGGDGKIGTSSNIVITNNRISRIFFPQGGYYGPVTAFDAQGPGNVWSGNVWDDGDHAEIGPNG
ncbi:MAG: hypothetical protein ABW004_05180 [Aeromicrobium sp.]